MSLDRFVPPTPVVIDEVLQDPDFVYEIARRGAPYSCVQRYLKNLAEMSALSDAGRGAADDSAQAFIAPWFRGDWARDTALVDGADTLLHLPAFVDGARKLFGAARVRPTLVYANFNPPMPAVDPGHLDVPAFRGFDRSTQPVWLLVAMQKSGLFESWRVKQATAVAWFYTGEGGGFTYWPEGPDAPPVRRPCVNNSAVVGDNERMFHRVQRIGPRGAELPGGLTINAGLHFDGDHYEIRDGGQMLYRWPRAHVRISVSWKAHVFVDRDEEKRFDDHSDDLTPSHVRRVFADDLARRGIAHKLEADFGSDLDSVRTISDTYQRSPTVFR